MLVINGSGIDSYLSFFAVSGIAGPGCLIWIMSDFTETAERGQEVFRLSNPGVCFLRLWDWVADPAEQEASAKIKNKWKFRTDGLNYFY
jgi:hypothetical protein